MRQSTLTVSSFAIVALAGAAIADAARAQAVPVSYPTDPGFDAAYYPAAPKGTERVVGEAAVAVAEPMALSFVQADPYARDPIYEIGARRSIEVGAGDTVYAVARRFGLAPTDIIKANNLSAPYTLKIGQVLVLPETATAQQTAAAQPAPAPTRPAPAPKRQAMPQPIPVSFAAVNEELPKGIYRVRPGDTLYSLSRRFEVPLETLAATNGITAPYSLAIDQQLVIPGAAAAAAATTPAAPSSASEAARQSENDSILVSKTPGSRFAWPLRGDIVMGFGVNDGGVRNDGINIAAPVGAPVRAAADGEVVYTGAELEGYGNLLLIRHEDGWVSAYAHTDTILVEKGEKVRQGQVVAKVGKTGAVEQSQLHFELRHELKPRDPVAALNGTDIKATVAFQR